MNKTEREKLREHANNHLNGRERDSTFFTPVEVTALLDHIDALEGLVEAAYREGYIDGSSFVNAIRDAPEYIDESWAESEAKAALTKAEGRENG